MPQGHRHQKSTGSDEIFHAHLSIETGSRLFCLSFQQGEMLNRCRADSSESVTSHRYFK
ncbi:hypothetical protein ECP030529311_0831 [Escherichia coli p0305293.11]|nr:hypothetical protein ECP030529311_0831 [Escherichia coli p0305293.11]